VHNNNGVDGMMSGVGWDGAEWDRMSGVSSGME
jgi:hypothetical protein